MPPAGGCVVARHAQPPFTSQIRNCSENEMRTSRRARWARWVWAPVIGCLTALCGAAPAAPQPFVNPIDQPAQSSALASRSTVLALATAGKRLIAAGVRGHIMWSDDAGQSWQQARVPVSVDLVGLSFPTPLLGWAVGHDGVVLHTADGGKTWQRQLAGLDATRAAVKAYEAAAPKNPQLLSGLRAQLTEPRGEPFLDVHFWNERSGFVIGTFGSIFRTDDGGRTWTPWMDRLDNPGALNLFAIRGRGDRIFVVGEQGKVWRFDPNGQRFLSFSTPYAGTLFGVHVADQGRLLVFGMRGSMLRSADDGATWSPVTTPTSAGLTAATDTADGRIVVGDQAGNLLVSRDGGATFARMPTQPPAPIFAVTSTGSRDIVLGGPIGLLAQPLP
jgi:photosystem II stability/assembly factor-like uncharacterized protein